MTWPWASYFDQPRDPAQVQVRLLAQHLGLGHVGCCFIGRSQATQQLMLGCFGLGTASLLLLAVLRIAGLTNQQTAAAPASLHAVWSRLALVT